MVARPEYVADSYQVDAGPVRGAGRRKTSVHTHAQKSPHPAPGSSGPRDEGGFLCAHLQGHRVSLQRIRYVFNYNEGINE